MDIISKMEYDDMVSCYEIIKKKQCVSYLKEDILNMINQKVISDVRNSLNLPFDENVYFDLSHIKGRTYEIGIRLNIQTEHIYYNKLFNNRWRDLDRLNSFPKIVFSKNVLDIKEIELTEGNIQELQKIYNRVMTFKNEILDYEQEILSYEGDKYKIRMKNDLYTVLVKNNETFTILLENKYIKELDINDLNKEIENVISDNNNKAFLDLLINSDEYKTFVSDIKSYEVNIRLDISKYTGFNCNGIRFKMYICNRRVYDEELNVDIDDFIVKMNECKSKINEFMKSYNIILSLVNEINNCKNNFWKATFLFDYNGYPTVELDQKHFIPNKYLTLEKIRFDDFDSLSRDNIIYSLKTGMLNVMDNMQRCGYRVMEVCD